MATNKNQHFVPKCYLRPFTVETGNAAIHLFNVDRRRIVLNASVRNQCSGDYFYGSNAKLERALQTTEGAYATLLKDIQGTGYRLNDAHKVQLRRFWLLQYMRTDAASRYTVAMADDTDALLTGGSGAFKLGIKDAVQISMSAFVDTMDILHDLKLCLVRNRTRVPLVTSDNPAVMTNRWYQQSPRARGQSCGLNAAGTIIYLPLSPRIMCLVYDGDVYTVPHENGWVTADRESDINAFNELQFINCQANVFFHDSSDAQLVEGSFAEIASQRPSFRHRLHYAVLDNEEGDTKRYRVVDRKRAKASEEAIIHMQSVNVYPATWPSQIAWRHKGYVYSNGTAVGYVRKAHTIASATRPFRKELAR